MKGFFAAAIVAVPTTYFGVNIYLSASVKHEVRWQQFELETLRTVTYENVEAEISERETLVANLNAWLALPVWTKWQTPPPRNKLCDYI